MAPQYASGQPAGSPNRLENVAIVGASGRIGEFVTREILKLGRQRVTALTRKDSASTMPEGIAVKEVDYNDPSSLVEALRGHDLLIITMGVTAPPDTERKLIDAAAEAGVTWIVPNGWGYDTGSEQLRKDLSMNAKAAETRNYIERLGLSWIGIACGFWYEFSLAGTVPQPEYRFGFDFDKKTLVLFDDGTTKLNVSTWPQVGRGTANLLDMKIFRDDEHDKSPCLDGFRNGYVYITSFRLSQRNMLDSVLRVTGDKESDWKLSSEPVQERYKEGLAELSAGNRMGFMKMLYARYFFQDLEGDPEGRNLRDNDILGLPEENLDEFTKLSLEMKAKASG